MSFSACGPLSWATIPFWFFICLLILVKLNTGGKLTPKEEIMKQRFILLSTVFIIAFAWLIAGPAAYAAEPIVIGVPTSLGFLEGKEAHKVVQMAASEINATIEWIS